MTTKESIVIAVANHKGGVGKTTTALNTAAAFARTGKKTLIIDFDPQANLTMGLLQKDVYLRIKENTLIYDALIKGEDLQIINIEENLDLVPGSLKMADAELDLISTMARETKLKKALKKFKEYEVIIIDCPPSLNLLTINALVASNYVLIPYLADYFTLNSLQSITRIFNQVKENFNSDIEILGMFATKYNDTINLSKQFRNQVEEQFGSVFLKTCIRMNVALSESITPPYSTHIFNYSEKSNGALDYKTLFQEIEMKLWQ
jgi:chromosome partitioning protein